VSGRRLRARELDRLLRGTLAGSPAPAEEDRLRSAMRGAWAEALAATRPAAPGVPVVGWRPRPALGFAAGLVAALAVAVHLASPPHLVASSLAARGELLRAVAQLHRAQAMACRVDTADEAGRPRRYHLEWRAPGEARIRLDQPDGATWVRSVPSRRTGLLIGAPAPADEGDSRLSPVRDLLGPERVAALLDGRSGVRVTLDTATGLPVRLEARWAATCRFELAQPALLPLAGEGSRP